VATKHGAAVGIEPYRPLARYQPILLDHSRGAPGVVKSTFGGGAHFAGQQAEALCLAQPFTGHPTEWIDAEQGIEKRHHLI